LNGDTQNHGHEEEDAEIFRPFQSLIQQQRDYQSKRKLNGRHHNHKYQGALQRLQVVA
jgi:hypothetical protein